MPRGGARNRSGPPPDENSGRSDRRDFKLTALPPEGYDGKAPDFPLPDMTDRESEVWQQVWRYPQAWAWINLPRLWRHVAMYVRWSVRMEAEDASAALGNVVMRYADDAGISEAGMRFHGWKIAPPEESEAPANDAEPGDANVTALSDWLAGGA